MSDPQEKATDLDSGRILRALLFSDGLFSSANDLARCMAAASNGALKEDSANTAISLVLNGKRPTTRIFRETLEKATRLRSANETQGKQNELIDRISDLLDELERQREHQAYERVGLGRSLEEISRIAKTKFVIAPGVARLISGQDPDTRVFRGTRSKVIQLIAQGLRLFDPDQPQPQSRLDICFRSDVEGLLFWQDLLAYTVFRWPNGEMKDGTKAVAQIDDVIDRLVKLEKDRFVRTFHIHEAYCLSPVALYDPETSHACGFHIYYAGSEIVPYSIPDPYLKIWQAFYRDFVEKRTLQPSEQIKFKGHIDFFRQQAKLEATASTMF